ncbi:MAG: putative ABC transporter permease subunit, partial [Desulfatiglandales bacterium]
SKDLEFLHASPIRIDSLFVGRAIISIFDSSWMVLLFLVPILSAYGIAYMPGAYFYVKLILLSVCLVSIGGYIGIIVTILLVSALPARRVRDVVVILGIVFFIIVYLLFRTMRPEQLVNPDSFMDITDYLSYLSSPYMAALPSRWVVEVLWEYIHGSGRVISIPELLTYNTLLLIFLLSIILSRHLYRLGLFKALEGRSRHQKAGKVLEFLSKIAALPYPKEMGSILIKDIKLFFRDNTQWTQLLLLGALIFVYIYNFSVLPLHKSPVRMDFLQNTLAFLNLGLTSFIISALGARFVYPSISMEGEGFWLLKSSPLGVKQLVIAKFFFHYMILSALSLLLLTISNVFLNVDKSTMILTGTTVILLTFAIVAIAIGFGCMYPVFRYESLTNVVTGFGAFIYMLFSALLIVLCIIIEAGPLYSIFVKGIGISKEEGVITNLIISVLIVAIICIGSGFYFLRKGILSLENIEDF